MIHAQGEGQNCEFWRFIIGKDEMAMQCEVGLYLDFGVKDGGPTGCSGRLDNFHMGRWAQGRNTGVNLPEGYCPRNLMAFPPGSTPSADLIDLYAEDQAAWVQDFSTALVAMLANKNLQLVDSGYTAPFATFRMRMDSSPVIQSAAQEVVEILKVPLLLEVAPLTMVQYGSPPTQQAGFDFGQ